MFGPYLPQRYFRADRSRMALVLLPTPRRRGLDHHPSPSGPSPCMHIRETHFPKDQSLIQRSCVLLIKSSKTCSAFHGRRYTVRLAGLKHFSQCLSWMGMVLYTDRPADSCTDSQKYGCNLTSDVISLSIMSFNANSGEHWLPPPPPSNFKMALSA